MSDIETYGGCCPNCEKPMLMKHNSSQSGLSFDACVHCGYMYGTYFTENKGITDIEGQKAVDMFFNIIDHHSVNTFDELREIYKDYKVGKDIDEIYPSVFDYSKDTKEEIKSRVVDLKSIPIVPNSKHRL